MHASQVPSLCPEYYGKSRVQEPCNIASSSFEVTLFGDVVMETSSQALGIDLHHSPHT